MQKDIILEKFFEYNRWETAIQTGVDKNINKTKLRELCTEEKRKELLLKIVQGNYKIAPPHQQEIPKDDGTMRIVYINEDIDRIFLSISNDLLFELMPEMLHSRCKSYQKGIGCGKIVQQISSEIMKYYDNGNIVGFKADLSKYFDSVPIKYIDNIFDKVEEKYGKSKVIDIIRDYYHQDLCFNPQKELISHYQSLKQGCAVASWLADVLLYHIDERLANMKGYYVRYSDDILYIGSDYEQAYEILARELNKMELILNPKKVELLSKDRWFKFLGFSIKGNLISLSKKRLGNFVKEIKHRTRYGLNYDKSVKLVNEYLYKGDYCWTKSVLAIINCQKDIDTMNTYIQDRLRMTITKKYHNFGLGTQYNHDNYCIERGNSKGIKNNISKTDKELKDYKSLTCMRNVLLTNGTNVFDAIVSVTM